MTTSFVAFRDAAIKDARTIQASSERVKTLTPKVLSNAYYASLEIENTYSTGEAFFKDRFDMAIDDIRFPGTSSERETAKKRLRDYLRKVVVRGWRIGYYVLFINQMSPGERAGVDALARMSESYAKGLKLIKVNLTDAEWNLLVLDLKQARDNPQAQLVNEAEPEIEPEIEPEADPEAPTVISADMVYATLDACDDESLQNIIAYATELLAERASLTRLAA
jgi:hypothetical protein